jgi:hypothetical protein
MPVHEPSRFPKRVLERYADLLLHHVYQHGGRKRYVPIAEIEDALGLEAELILDICRTRLLGEIHVTDRLRAELEDCAEARTAIERHWLRICLAEPHVRIRPAAVRLTEQELLRLRKKQDKRKRKLGRPRG